MGGFKDVNVVEKFVDFLIELGDVDPGVIGDLRFLMGCFRGLDPCCSGADSWIGDRMRVGKRNCAKFGDFRKLFAIWRGPT